jgi:hypothetical protein
MGDSWLMTQFAWNLIDHTLVGLKLSDLSEEMRKSIEDEERQIRDDNRLNQNSQAVPSLLVQMHERRTDEWAEKTYKVYCDVWEKQGYRKTAEFVRAVSAHAIPTIIAARTGAVISQLSAERKRTGSVMEPHNARMASFKQSMERLAGRWARKLNGEARECEHAENAMRRNAHREHDERQTNQPVLHEGPKSPPAADARTVAPGVAQVSLADLNVPVGTSLKEAKRALLKLGTPARKLKDPRILEAADYKIENPKSSYKEVSIKFFRTSRRADSIRSWVNKRKPQDGRK